MADWSFGASHGRWWRIIRVLTPRGYRFDLYTEEALRALAFARDAVTESGGSVLLAEHVLVGILRCDPELLQRSGVSASEADALAAQMLQRIRKPELLPATTGTPFSRAARQVLRTAGREASRRRGRVSLEHLLSALVRHDGPAGRMLRQHGMHG